MCSFKGHWEVQLKATVCRGFPFRFHSFRFAGSFSFRDLFHSVGTRVYLGKGQGLRSMQKSTADSFYCNCSSRAMMYLQRVAGYWEPNASLLPPNHPIAGRKKIPGLVRDAPMLRPAGQPSQFRAVAALLSLRQLADSDFRDIGGCWVGALFEHGHLYRCASSSMPMLCLGFHYKIAFMFHVQELEQGFFRLSEDSATEPLDARDAASKFEPVCLTSINKAVSDAVEPWTGIPVKVCDLPRLFVFCYDCLRNLSGFFCTFYLDLPKNTLPLGANFLEP